jgi:hypothetical protein
MGTGDVSCRRFIIPAVLVKEQPTCHLQSPLVLLATWFPAFFLSRGQGVQIIDVSSLSQPKHIFILNSNVAASLG